MPRPTRCKSAIRAALALALAAGFGQPALAGPTDTGAAAAVAEVAVMEPLQLVKMRDLDFARIGPTPTAGTVVLNPNDNSCTATGGLLHIGTCQAAVFGGMGARRMIVRINAPTTITLTGPGQAMVIDTITLDTVPDLQLQPNGNGNGNGNGNRRYRIVSNSGIFAFNLGGTLRVNANQAPGVYSASFDVTAVYQ
jgi:Domain of unknown function (DUF4402)